MMRILGTGLPLPLWRRAFRKELREEGAPAPKALSPKPERSAETETKAKTKRLEKVKGSRRGLTRLMSRRARGACHIR
jgi:hypothetical protein